MVVEREQGYSTLSSEVDILRSLGSSLSCVSKSSNNRVMLWLARKNVENLSQAGIHFNCYLTYVPGINGMFLFFLFLSFFFLQQHIEPSPIPPFNQKGKILGKDRKKN